MLVVCKICGKAPSAMFAAEPAMEEHWGTSSALRFKMRKEVGEREDSIWVSDVGMRLRGLGERRCDCDFQRFPEIELDTS